MRKVAGGVLTAVTLGGYALLAPWSDVELIARRLLPILVFLAAISVVVNLSARSGLFRRIAVVAPRLSRGRNWLLWLAVVSLSVVCTAFLSLDTTAVLVTPLALALASAAGVSPLPFALTIVWIANTGSLFLPVSNLTNLLAVQALDFGGAPGFARTAFWPAAMAVVVTVAFAFVVFRRNLLGSHRPLDALPVRPVDKVLVTACAIVLVVLLPTLVTTVPVWLSASCGAVVLLAVFSVRDRSGVGLALVPWPGIALACCLVVVVHALNQLGVAGAVVSALATEDPGYLGVLSLGAAGAVAANLVNNIPAYLLLEPAAGGAKSALALLIGTNVGPLITPWASLATILWHDQLRRSGVQVSWWRFIALGAILAPLSTSAALLTLAL